jgi:hypothetical protein
MGPGVEGTSLPTQMERGALGTLQEVFIAVTLTTPPVKPVPILTVSVLVLFDNDTWVIPTGSVQV